MLKLNSNEISKLRSDELKRMRKRVTDYYISNSSKFNKNKSAKEFIEDIEHGLKRATRFDLNTEYSLIKYLEMMFTISSQFDEQADIRRMLADEEKSANNKTDSVYKKLTI